MMGSFVETQTLLYSHSAPCTLNPKPYQGPNSLKTLGFLPPPPTSSYGFPKPTAFPKLQWKPRQRWSSEALGPHSQHPKPKALSPKALNPKPLTRKEPSSITCCWSSRRSCFSWPGTQLHSSTLEPLQPYQGTGFWGFRV